MLYSIDLYFLVFLSLSLSLSLSPAGARGWEAGATNRGRGWGAGATNRGRGWGVGATNRGGATNIGQVVGQGEARNANVKTTNNRRLQGTPTPQCPAPNGLFPFIPVSGNT